MANTVGRGICLLLQDKEAGRYELETILNYISNFFQREGFIERQKREGKYSYKKIITIPAIKQKSITNLGYSTNIDFDYTVNVDFDYIYKHSNRNNFITITPGTFSLGSAFPYNPEEKQMEVINKLSKELRGKFELQEIYKCLDESYAIEV